MTSKGAAVVKMVRNTSWIINMCRGGVTHYRPEGSAICCRTVPLSCVSWSCITVWHQGVSLLFFFKATNKHTLWFSKQAVWGAWRKSIHYGHGWNATEFSPHQKKSWKWWFFISWLFNHHQYIGVWYWLKFQNLMTPLQGLRAVTWSSLWSNFWFQIHITNVSHIVVLAMYP